MKTNFPVFFFLFVINLCYIIREISLFPPVYYPAPATININILEAVCSKVGPVGIQKVEVAEQEVQEKGKREIPEHLSNLILIVAGDG